MVVLKTLACDSAAPRAAGGRHSANCTPTYRRRARTVLWVAGVRPMAGWPSGWCASAAHRALHAVGRAEHPGLATGRKCRAIQTPLGVFQ